VVEVAADCDGDALLVRADPVGPTCHREVRSCFDPAAGAAEPGSEGAGSASPGAAAAPPPNLELGWLAAVVAERAAAGPAASYTARLLAAGVERAAQKVGEEATEVVIAALAAARPAQGEAASGAGGTADLAGDLAGETADLLYHLLVLLRAVGVEPGRVAAELRRRHLGAPAAGADPGPGGTR
jgi:phosphoribosyl-ATP pyrophosphohydrolase/phosphoribosyl-AMP cyclohydrolase